jgi:hypothetical protein
VRPEGIATKRGRRHAAVCTACNRALTWARSSTGVWLRLEVARAYEVVEAFGQPHARLVRRPTYISHVLTCPRTLRCQGST